MSRFALEWAKRQHDVGLKERYMLVLFAERAYGAKHAFSWREEEILADTQATKRSLNRSLGILSGAGLIKSSWERDHSGLGSWGRPETIRLAGQLLIPADWRAFMIERPKGTAKESDRAAAVYRFFDAKGALLYIGKAVDPSDRFLEHQKDKFWWSEVVTREVVWFETEYLAEAEETRAIQAESPRYNIKDATTSGLRDEDRRAGRGRRFVVANGRFAKFLAALDVIRKAIGEASYGDALLPNDSELASRFGLDPFIVSQVLHYLHLHEELEVVEDDGTRRYQFVFYG